MELPRYSRSANIYYSCQIGWLEKLEIRLNSAQLELELGNITTLSLPRGNFLKIRIRIRRMIRIRLRIRIKIQIRITIGIRHLIMEGIRIRIKFVKMETRNRQTFRD